MQYADLDSTIKPAVEAAIKAKAHAYCPYSNFRVGSAVLTEDGQIFAGCNVESASYGLSVCAERVAIMNAVTHGYQSFKAIVVCCDIKGSFEGSCGACRQFYAEFGLDWEIYLVKPDKTWKKVLVKELLPMAFSPKSLQEERITDSSN
ncbi:cytidine deaminase-like [Gigantopelta aegis]|uniref:cytidine deaminase-like n=1 Tax=Gigantopelta aegis TaxID=1735272 RepID=UPI001B88926C|nr:cytidine deaminase-like [Gigantopelta aegis]